METGWPLELFHPSPPPQHTDLLLIVLSDSNCFLFKLISISAGNLKSSNINYRRTLSLLSITSKLLLFL